MDELIRLPCMLKVQVKIPRKTFSKPEPSKDDGPWRVFIQAIQWRQDIQHVQRWMRSADSDALETGVSEFLRQVDLVRKKPNVTRAEIRKCLGLAREGYRGIIKGRAQRRAGGPGRTSSRRRRAADAYIIACYLEVIDLYRDPSKRIFANDLDEAKVVQKRTALKALHQLWHDQWSREHNVSISYPFSNT